MCTAWQGLLAAFPGAQVQVFDLSGAVSTILAGVAGGGVPQLALMGLTGRCDVLYRAVCLVFAGDSAVQGRCCTRPPSQPWVPRGRVSHCPHIQGGVTWSEHRVTGGVTWSDVCVCETGSGLIVTHCVNQGTISVSGVTGGTPLLCGYLIGVCVSKHLNHCSVQTV